MSLIFMSLFRGGWQVQNLICTMSPFLLFFQFDDRRSRTQEIEVSVSDDDGDGTLLIEVIELILESTIEVSLYRPFIENTSNLGMWQRRQSSNSKLLLTRIRVLAQCKIYICNAFSESAYVYLLNLTPQSQMNYCLLV